MTYRGGNFYVHATVPIPARPGSSKVVAEAQRHTFQEAKDWLDSRDQAGGIEEWVERTQQRQARARRTAEGQWFKLVGWREVPLEEPKPSSPAI